MELNGLIENMQVGIFCLTSDSTHVLAIHASKAVMSALVTQANNLQDKDLSNLSYEREQPSQLLNRDLHGGLDSLAAKGHQKLDSVVTSYF